ncbi:MAG: MerC domain-containing protein [Acidiferrobacterales bacterium]|nr:MerC domain-containing protein [Acidiferrobacterales bacterium]
MNKLSSLTNNLAIGLSALCAVHCLATPLLLVLLPSLTAFPLEGEAFHKGLLILVIPSSLFSLFMGCKQHQSHRIVAIGIVGLALLLVALMFEDMANGELLEKIFTVLGAAIVAYSHILNFRLCRASECGNCEAQA